MSFIHPLMLGLLAAAALPIFIHLYNRKKAVKRRFPALSFLLRSQQKIARSLKLRQWLLLALRIGVFLLIPLALAKPFILSDDGTTASDRLPSAVVYILDDSLTMASKTADGTRYDDARARLKAHLKTLNRGDQVTLVYASDPERLPFDDWLDDRDLLNEEIKKHPQQSQRGDLRRSLEVARDFLVANQHPIRKIVLLTDLTGSSWPENVSGDLLGGVGSVEVIDLGQDELNLTLGSVSYRPAPSGLPDDYRIEVTALSRNTKETLDLAIALEVNGIEVSLIALKLPPGQPTRALFTHRFKEEIPHQITVRIKDAPDTLLEDNLQHLILHRDQNIRVLLVNGDAQDTPLEDELFFLQRALHPTKGSASRITPIVTTPRRLSLASFKDIDVAILANVGKLTTAQGQHITRFVEGGGGLFISMGDQVDAASFNALLGDLLPRPLRGAKRVARGDNALLQKNHFGRRERHPALDHFDLPGGRALQEVPVKTFMQVEPRRAKNSRILISYTNKAPALLERSVGSGKVILLTTSLDRDWSELALRKPFLPLIRQITRYLARRLDAPQGDPAIVGKPQRFQLEEGSGGLLIKGKTQQVSFSQELLAAQHWKARWSPDRPGFFKVLTQEGAQSLERPEMAFAANLDPKASVSTRRSLEKLSAYWSTPESPGAAFDDPSPYDNAERRIEIWPILLLLVLFFLYLESLLGLRRSFVRKLKQAIGFSKNEKNATAGSAPK